VGVCVSATLAISVTGLTIRAALIAGLAIVALLLTGWRKPARAEPGSPRGGLGGGGALGGAMVGSIRPKRSDPYATGVAVEHLDTPAERKVGVVRRVLALAASGGIAIGMGVLTAIVIAFALAWAVIWLTALLRG
jgi:hypothetical protein